MLPANSRLAMEIGLRIELDPADKSFPAQPFTKSTPE
jgi:hypothetical protein